MTGLEFRNVDLNGYFRGLCDFGLCGLSCFGLEVNKAFMFRPCLAKLFFNEKKDGDFLIDTLSRFSPFISLLIKRKKNKIETTLRAW